MIVEMFCLVFGLSLVVICAVCFGLLKVGLVFVYLVVCGFGCGYTRVLFGFWWFICA